MLARVIKEESVVRYELGTEDYETEDRRPEKEVLRKVWIEPSQVLLIPVPEVDSEADQAFDLSRDDDLLAVFKDIAQHVFLRFQLTHLLDSLQHCRVLGGKKYMNLIINRKMEGFIEYGFRGPLANSILHDSHNSPERAAGAEAGTNAARTHAIVR